MSPAARAWALAAGLCGLVLIADQAAKAVVEDRLVIGQRVEVLGPLELTLAHNSGVAFGLAGGAGVGLVLVTLVALAVVAYLFSRNPTRSGMWVAVGLVAGGALGNLIDRIRADHVTDFIHIGSWPAFNLADISISAGVILLVLLYLRDAEAEDPNGEPERREEAGETNGG
ncbi:MAG TPA: signal peptidase II [Solirubrobacterales bacterium]|nr:signal peptidase II [Solirubrobacterales bacterium]